uniref:Uncharacterized protein n=1 Tax=Tetradesmus obliquus TaxID=3088 RepID=A0A383V9Z5_TETOB
MQCRSASDCRDGSRCVSGWCLSPAAPSSPPPAAAAPRAQPPGPAAPNSGGSALNDCSKRGTCGGSSCRARTDCENGLRCVSGTCTKNRHRRLQAAA